MDELKSVILEIKKAMVGKDDIILKMILAILARGHVLLEDIPGVGKTNLALALSKSMSLDYHRIQLTTDVMPSDIVGFTMYNPQKNNFEYKAGIAFCHLLLADEINRTSSKTQAALLELMEEGRMTVDGITRELPKPFFVIATQNPFGSAGTQLLPDSQLDRFMVRLSLGYPQVNEEIEVLKARQKSNPLDTIHAILTPETIIAVQNKVDDVFVNDDIYQYIVNLIESTRHHQWVQQGASPRGSLCLMRMAKAYAFIEGRDYVIPQDVQAIIKETIAHRLILNYDAKMKNISAFEVIEDILKTVKEPGI